jgi:CheY-like chemotaxis protein
LKQGQQSHLLFTDIVLPDGMDGRQFADTVRKMRPEIKVLFTSGYTENTTVHDGQLDPDVELLRKPCRREQMAAKVRKVLDRR